MKIFEILNAATVVEPQMTGPDVPMVYLSDQFLALLIGDEMPSENENIRECDVSDLDTRKQILASMEAFNSFEDMTNEQSQVYKELDRAASKENIIQEHQKRVAAFINYGTTRTTYEEAIIRRDELMGHKLALDFKLKEGGALTDEEEHLLAVISHGALEFLRLEGVSKTLCEALPDDYYEDVHWVKL